MAREWYAQLYICAVSGAERLQLERGSEWLSSVVQTFAYRIIFMALLWSDTCGK